jgi:hypothetical protein
VKKYLMLSVIIAVLLAGLLAIAYRYQGFQEYTVFHTGKGADIYGTVHISHEIFTENNQVYMKSKISYIELGEMSRSFGSGGGSVAMSIMPCNSSNFEDQFISFVFAPGSDPSSWRSDQYTKVLCKGFMSIYLLPRDVEIGFYENYRRKIDVYSFPYDAIILHPSDYELIGYISTTLNDLETNKNLEQLIRSDFAFEHKFNIAGRKISKQGDILVIERSFIYKYFTPLLITLLMIFIVMTIFIKDLMVFCEFVIAIIFGLWGGKQILLPSDVVGFLALDIIFFGLYVILGIFIFINLILFIFRKNSNSQGRAFHNTGNFLDNNISDEKYVNRLIYEIVTEGKNRKSPKDSEIV